MTKLNGHDFFNILNKSSFLKLFDKALFFPIKLGVYKCEAHRKIKFTIFTCEFLSFIVIIV